MELQVAFKLLLGGDKDLEDARHLYEVAREIIDRAEVSEWVRRLRVPEETLARSRMRF